MANSFRAHLGASVWSLACLLFGGLPACSSSDSDGASSEQQPAASTLDYEVDQPGPFHTGFRSFKTTYRPKGVSDDRTIVVNVWYPTNATEGDAATYLLGADQDAFVDAPPAPPVDGKGYPVRVHSHGFAAYGGSSAALMRYFASHGWATIAPDHTGNTLTQHGDPIPLIHHLVRPQDISASLDALEQLPASDPLSGQLHTDRVLLSGHSFGCETTWAVAGARFDTDFIQKLCDEGTTFSEPCGAGEVEEFASIDVSDPRIIAGVPMAGGVGVNGGWFGKTGYDVVAKPMFLMSGGEDQVGADRVFDLVSALDFTWVEIAGGCHELFNLGGCPKVPSQEGYDIVQTYMLAFGRRHLLGDTSEKVSTILDGSRPLSSRVTFKHKGPEAGGAR